MIIAYEYKLVDCGDKTVLREQLTKYGKEGWKAIQIFPYTYKIPPSVSSGNIDTNGYTIIFERPN